MPKAIIVENIGAPSVMKWRDVEVGRPGKDEVTVRAKAIGVNFIDIYQRSGLYPMPLPFTPGGEVCGEIEAIGPDVSSFKIGDRGGNGHSGVWLLCRADQYRCREARKSPEGNLERCRRCDDATRNDRSISHPPSLQSR